MSAYSVRLCAKAVKSLSDITVGQSPETLVGGDCEKSYVPPAESLDYMGFFLTLFAAQVFIVVMLAYRPFLETRNSMSVVGCRGVHDPRE